eukprot:jgi/Galph1/1497/GphlegSOOS_G167.1
MDIPTGQELVIEAPSVKVKSVVPARIRNFSIIAHIDHGKSTLADRLLQLTDTVTTREMKEQFLDSMDLERERGITIKLQTARMNYKGSDGYDYVLNLIDTPGHVDFSYEVSRSLMACEGAILVVDASQGVEAQTLANVYFALENGLEIVPILNKVDLPSAEPTRVKQEIEQEFETIEVGVLAPNQTPVSRLIAGESGITITLADQPAMKPLSGYKEAKPMVFCGLYPVDADQFEDLRESLEKLKLNDAALSYEPESSSAMGFGFRCGFLGLLHMEIVCERLTREYNLDLVTTSPSVGYLVHFMDKKKPPILIQNPCDLPEPHLLDHIEEPYVRLEIITPSEYVGTLMELTQSRRGIFKDMTYITAERASLVYELPLAELVTNFFDQVKSRSRGYASMEYQWSGFQSSDLVKLEVAVNGERVDVNLQNEWMHFAPLFIAINHIRLLGMIGNRVIASEHIPALRKNVLAKCYGGDVSRKKKLLKETSRRKESE